MTGTKLICMIELEISGGFDWSDCRLVAEQFAEAELESRSGIDGLKGSAFKGVKLHLGNGIRYQLEQLRKLSNAKANYWEGCVPCALSDDFADFWYSKEALELYESLEEVIDDTEEELDVLPDEVDGMNPHRAAQDEAMLSLHDRETDLDCVYS
jgi:hypothetical protein